jgi:hypothetical protein
MPISGKVYRRCWLFTVICVCLGGPPLAISQQPTPRLKSDWPKIEQVINAHFLAISGWHPQSLISQSNVETLWPELAKAGWKVSDTDAIVKLVPRDEEFLARQMRTSAGKRFMRDVAVDYPAIYDRLDRISRQPSGQVNMAGLIAAPDADLTVRYMMTKEGSRSWASLLGMKEKHIFSTPTGRLYTAELLTEYLKQLYTSTP